MARVDDELWRTLARIYLVILCCGVCVPLFAAIPVLAGFDSFIPPLVFGVVGLGFAGGVTYLVDTQFAAVVARRFDPDVEPAERPGDSART